jgi:hypothetical protein
MGPWAAAADMATGSMARSVANRAQRARASRASLSPVLTGVRLHGFLTPLTVMPGLSPAKPELSSHKFSSFRKWFGKFFAD